MRREKSERMVYEFSIRSITCTSCELNIENKIKKLLDVENVVVDYKTKKLKVTGNLGSNKKAFKKINQVISELGYSLDNNSHRINFQKVDFLISFLITFFILLIFYFINKFNLVDFSFNINNPISYFFLGIMASFSSCAAIVGTILISIISRDIKLGVSKSQMIMNQITFHISRFISFIFFGGILGLIGQSIDIVYILVFFLSSLLLYYFINNFKFPVIQFIVNSKIFFVKIFYFLILFLVIFFTLFQIIKFLSTLTNIDLNILSQSIFIIFITTYLLLLALNLLGFLNIRLIQFRLPKNIEHKILNKQEARGILPSIFLGTFSFFLPCGFTFTAQNGALLSSSFYSGALLMFLFSLGTFPLLLLISLAFYKFNDSSNLRRILLIVSSFLMIFIAIYNIIGALKLIGFVF